MDVLKKTTVNLHESYYPEIVKEVLREESHVLQAQYVSYIRNRIEYGFIDVHKLFAEAGSQVETINDLWFLGLLIRLGAQVNGYIYTAELGNIHQLAYIASKKTNGQLLNIIFSFFRRAGANENMPVFQDFNKFTPLDRELIIKLGGAKRSVRDWLIQERQITLSEMKEDLLLENYFHFILDQTDSFDMTLVRPVLRLLSPRNKNLMDRYVEEMTTYQDDFGNVTQVPTGKRKLIFTPADQELQDNALTLQIVRLHNINFVNNFDPDFYLNQYFLSESYPIQLVVSTGNLSLFELFVNMGCDVDYFTINRIFFGLKFAKDFGDNLLEGFLTKMLLYTVENSFDISKAQLAIRPDMLDDIGDAYKQPKWIKHMNDESSVYLQNLARNLGLPSGLINEELQEKLTEILENQDDYISLFKDIQSTKIGKNLQLEDFIIVTKSLSGEDPLLYIDDRIVYYNNKLEVYVFTADYFETLLGTGLNPFNNQPLPERVILEMKMKMELLTSQGQDVDHSIKDTLDEVSKPDTIDDEFIKRVVRTNEMILRMNGIKDVPLKLNQEIELAKLLGISSEFFKDMSAAHRRETLNIGEYHYLTMARDPTPLFRFLKNGPRPLPPPSDKGN